MNSKIQTIRIWSVYCRSNWNCWFYEPGHKIVFTGPVNFMNLSLPVNKAKM